MRGARAILRNDQGAALLLAIALATVLGALAAVMALTARTETLVAGRFQQGHEALYVAEGVLARALQDLSSAPEWGSALSGALSSFTDGAASTERALPGGGRVLLCCGATSLSADVERTANGGRNWGPDTPVWRPYAWGPASAWLAPGALPSAFYGAVWIADDPADGDGNPAADANAVVALYAVALGPAGARRGVRALVARPVDGGGMPLPRGVRLLSWHEGQW